MTKYIKILKNLNILSSGNQIGNIEIYFRDNIMIIKIL